MQLVVITVTPCFHLTEVLLFGSISGSVTFSSSDWWAKLPLELATAEFVMSPSAQTNDASSGWRMWIGCGLPKTNRSPPAFTMPESAPFLLSVSVARSTAYPLAMPPRSIHKRRFTVTKLFRRRITSSKDASLSCECDPSGLGRTPWSTSFPPTVTSKTPVESRLIILAHESTS